MGVNLHTYIIINILYIYCTVLPRGILTLIVRGNRVGLGVMCSVTRHTPHCLSEDCFDVHEIGSALLLLRDTVYEISTSASRLKIRNGMRYYGSADIPVSVSENVFANEMTR